MDGWPNVILGHASNAQRADIASKVCIERRRLRIYSPFLNLFDNYHVSQATRLHGRRTKSKDEEACALCIQACDYINLLPGVTKLIWLSVISHIQNIKIIINNQLSWFDESCHWILSTVNKESVATGNYRRPLDDRTTHLLWDEAVSLNHRWLEGLSALLSLLP